MSPIWIYTSVFCSPTSTFPVKRKSGVDYKPVTSNENQKPEMKKKIQKQKSESRNKMPNSRNEKSGSRNKPPQHNSTGPRKTISSLWRLQTRDTLKNVTLCCVCQDFCLSSYTAQFTVGILVLIYTDLLILCRSLIDLKFTGKKKMKKQNWI